MTLRMIDLFSGIGGFSLAARWTGGIQTVQFVEREPFCQKILRKHWPDVPIHDDVCTFNPEPGAADIVCGGFPCQDISTAGKQAGIKEGTRSGLFYELMRIVRMVGPQFVVLENVSAITSNGMDTVFGTLAEAGFDAEWACIPAADLGACHRRDRWWCVAYAHHAGVEAHRSQQLAARTEQRGELAAADSDRRLVQRQRGSTVLAAAQGAGQVDSQQWQRDGNAVASGGETAHPYGHRLEGQNELASGRQEWSATSARLNPDWHRYLSEPVLCRGNDGLSGRVDRLRALGNAVVPQVAAIPLARVLQLAAGHGLTMGPQ